MKLTQDNEAGFSIVSVLVALALISITAVTAGQAFINSMRARAKLATKLNFEEVNQSLFKIMKNLGRNPPSSGCYTAANIAQTMAAYPFVSLSSQVTTGLTSSQLAAVSTPRHDFVATAIQRCQTSKFIGNPASSADSTMYFCVRFQRDLQLDSSSINGSPHAFAEIKIQLINAHTNQPVSCDNFRNLTEGAMQVYSTLYWAHDSTNGLDYNRRNNFFHVTN